MLYFRKVNDFQWTVSSLCCALTLSHPCFLVSLQLVLDPLGFLETSGSSTNHRHVSGCTWRNMWLPCCSLHRQSMLSPSKVKRTSKARLDSAIIHLFLGPVVRLHHSLYWPQWGVPSSFWETLQYLLVQFKHVSWFSFKVSIWRVCWLCHLFLLLDILEVCLWCCNMSFVESRVYEYEKQEICMIIVHSSLKFSFVWGQSLYQCMKHLINEPQLLKKKWNKRT